MPGISTDFTKVPKRSAIPLQYARRPLLPGKTHGTRWVFAIVTLAILVVLIIAMVLPLIRPLSHRNPINHTRVVIDSLSYAAMVFHQDHGCFPSNADGLRILVSPSVGTVYYNGKWPLTDAWGNPFIYGSTTVYSSVTKSRSNFVIISRGPDGILGTPDDIIYRSGMVNDVSPFATQPTPAPATASPSPATR